MKKLIWLVIPLLMTTYACDKGSMGGGGASLPMGSLADSVSYAIGVQMADQFKQSMDTYGEDYFKADFMINGIQEAIKGNARIETKDMRALMTTFQQQLQQKDQQIQEKAGAANRAEGAAFLEANAKKEGVVTTASGLQYIVNEPGSGASPTTADKVEVHYEGRLLSGDVFDSSKGGNPVTFGVTQVISGWVEGLQLMKPGAKYTFFIPSELAYGRRGSPPKIGADATLVFDVELLKVNP